VAEVGKKIFGGENCITVEWKNKFTMTEIGTLENYVN
jgi:hypothetical protein